MDGLGSSRQNDRARGWGWRAGRICAQPASPSPAPARLAHSEPVALRRHAGRYLATN